MDMLDCGIELPLGVPETLINGLPDLGLPTLKISLSALLISTDFAHPLNPYFFQ